jgi:phage tail-like protein
MSAAPAKVTEANPPITHAKFFQVSIPVLSLQLGFFTQVSGFSSQVDVMEYPEGGINTFVHRLPGRIKQGNITLKRGITTEKALLQWFEKSVIKVEPCDLSIGILDYEGKPVQTWSFRNAYPVKWTGTDLNAGGSEFLTQSLEIAHNGMKVM